MLQAEKPDLLSFWLLAKFSHSDITHTDISMNKQKRFYSIEVYHILLPLISSVLQ